MDRSRLEFIVEEIVERLSSMKNASSHVTKIPVGVSARHVHLTKEHLSHLFGTGYELSVRYNLSQPGQFAAEETVLIAGPKGSLEGVRILGPFRSLTQVEVAMSDAYKLGVTPPIRNSGDVAGSAPITIAGPKGSLSLTEGLIVARRHVHMTPDNANQFAVRDGDVVSVRTFGFRSIVFDDVLIRVNPNYRLEMHVDTDEANAALLRTGDRLELLTYMKPENPHSIQKPDSPKQGCCPNVPKHFQGAVLTSQDVVKFPNGGAIQLSKGTLITPLARDVAKERSIAITEG
jgi:putative phosphotransacetylase